MTYLEAKRVEALFRRYRQLAVDYWTAVETIEYGRQGWMAGPDRPTHRETAASTPLRQQLVTMEPEVVHWAQKLGVSVSGISYPPPAVGGPALPFNMLTMVTNHWAGYRTVPRQEITDAIDKCIGAAEFVRDRLWHRLTRPWCWLVDVPALVVWWPFAVMRKAGVPDKIIESTGAQMLRAILTGVLWLGSLIGAATALF